MKTKDSKCSICRQAGEKLFLKGERCYSPKCALVKRNYPPGHQGKGRRRRRLSGYGEQLKEKQKLKNWYNLKEKKLKSYVKKALAARGQGEDSREIFIKLVEKRLDNVIFRLGFTPSRKEARQMVGHGHFKVNGRSVDIPSYRVEKGDEISLKEPSWDKGAFSQFEMRIKGHDTPAWLKLNVKKRKAEVVGEPSPEETSIPVDIATIFEFYSR